MREFLLLLIVAVFALPIVFNNQLQTFEPAMPVATPQPTIGISITIPTPGAFVGPPSNVIEAAMQWLGTPYLWGGCTRRGVDCSCFVQNALAVVGIKSPRTTTEQIKWATPVNRDQLQPTDLVFFNNTCTDCGANPTHVGLYLGNGLMIDAGDPVKIDPVFTGFYGARYAGAGRPH